MGIKAALPKYELYFYYTVLSMAMLWAASWIFEASSCKFEHTHTYCSQIRLKKKNFSLSICQLNANIFSPCNRSAIVLHRSVFMELFICPSRGTHGAAVLFKRPEQWSRARCRELCRSCSSDHVSVLIH